jgi:hypothetical protein
MLCTFTLALAAVCVQCAVWQFSVVPLSLIAQIYSAWRLDASSCPSATGITFACTFHRHTNITMIILVITSMQGTYNYTPETNPVFGVYVYSVASLLYLKFVLHVLLSRT